MTAKPRDTAAAILDQAKAAGLSIDDLVNASREAAPAPTVSELRPKVEASVDAGARTTYKTYWNDLEAAFGDTPLNQVSTTDLKVVANSVKARAKGKRADNAGRSAEEHFISAAKCFFGAAVEDGVISHSPAASLKKPRRGKGRRRPLTEAELRQVVEAAPVSSDDPQLDQLIVRFHLETGARRAGALYLKVQDLDFERQTVWLHEKYDQEREQPVTLGLLEALLEHAKSRGDLKKDSPVFYYRRQKDGKAHPLTHRRYNTVFPRLQKQVRFASNTQLDSHTLRTTAIALVERVSSHEVARTFAGHAETNVTSHYAKASIEEVAAAVSYLTGEAHPLAAKAD